jgi:RNA polymerase sigma-70 factor (ECF subfamily)
VLLLAHYEQLSLAEIAEITELEISAVKSRLQRARATLRETLAAYAPRTEAAL